MLLTIKKRSFTIILSIFLLLFFMVSTPFLYSQTITKEKLQIVHLYTPKDDEKPVHQFLFPIMTDYLLFLAQQYNQAVLDKKLPKKQIQKIFISELYRSRIAQRNQHFNYITSNKGFKNFFSLYDKNNEQFVVEFVKIVSPALKNTEASTEIFRSMNSELDKVFKSPLKMISNIPSSNYLTQYFNLNSVNSFVSSRESIEDIGDHIINVFEIDKEFIKTAHKELAKIIKTKLKLSTKESEKGSTQILNMIAAKSFFQYAHPILKKKGRDIFKDPMVGSALTIWFKQAPAYSKHSITDLTDEEISHIKATTDKRITYTFAVDLGMKTNKGLDGTSIWNYETKNNTLTILRQVITKKENLIFQTQGYQLEVIPSKLLTGKEENAVHIEFKMSLSPSSSHSKDDNPIVKDTPIEKENTVVSETLSETKEEKSPIRSDSSDKNKNFETPNIDSKNGKDKSAPDFTNKDFKRLDGKNKKQTDKTFELPN